jgi:hypothetical protein
MMVHISAVSQRLADAMAVNGSRANVTSSYVSLDAFVAAAADGWPDIDVYWTDSYTDFTAAQANALVAFANTEGKGLLLAGASVRVLQRTAARLRMTRRGAPARVSMCCVRVACAAVLSGGLYGGETCRCPILLAGHNWYWSYGNPNANAIRDHRANKVLW